MLRYRLSIPALWAHRARQLAGGRRPDGLRFILLHDVPERSYAALQNLIDIVRAQYGIVSPKDATTYLSGERALSQGETPCVFSFDDGFSCNLDVAKDVLEPNGIEGLFFVCPGLIDAAEQGLETRAIADGIFDGRQGADESAAQRKLMRWDDIRRLRAGGHVVGSHGLSHKRLSTLNGTQLEEEIEAANRRLVDELESPVDWYAFAFGDIDSVSSEALSIISRTHRFCRSGIRGPNYSTTDRFALRADSVNLSAPLAYNELIIEGGLDSRYRTARDRLDQMSVSGRAIQ